MTSPGSIAALVHGWTRYAVLAADEDIGKAGPVGLVLILSLLIVVFLLGRSMRTHLRRVPLEFPPPTPPSLPMPRDPPDLGTPATAEGPDTPRPGTG